MTISDEFVMALTMWRENRGGGLAGMQSVGNVVMNRAAARGTSPYQECVRPLQFSSLTAKGISELTLWPALTDTTWQMALNLAAMAAAGTLTDITGGAEDYYAPAAISTSATFQLPDGSVVPFPDQWNAQTVEYTATIAGQIFFKDISG